MIRGIARYIGQSIYVFWFNLFPPKVKEDGEPHSLDSHPEE